MTVSELVEGFIRQTERKGRSPNTIRSYRDRLKRFVEKFGGRKVKSLGREEILEYFHAVSVGVSNDTQRGNIIVVKGLQNHGRQFGHLKKRWFQNEDVTMPPAGRRDTLPTPEQTAVIFANGSPAFVSAYKALRYTGMRPGELCGALIENVEGKPGALVLVLPKHKTMNKTGKPSRVIIGAQAEAVFQQAIGERTSGNVFLDQRGMPWTRDRLSRRFREIRDKFSMSPKLVLYATRHECATLMMQAGDIMAASQQLRHSSLKTTERYAHPPESFIRAVQSRAIFDPVLKPDEDVSGAA